LDLFLVKRAEGAGAEVREGAASRRAKEAESEVIVSTDRGEVSARALIVAEGCTSRLASSLFGRYPSRSMAMGMATECNFGADPGDAMELHFVDTPVDPSVPRRTFPLNGWMFPHHEGGNIGVVGQGLTAAELRRGVEGIMKICGDRYGGTISRSGICAHPLPLRPRRQIHSRRTVLVGDAAGFVNPITGEGMSYAFASANIASASVADLLEKGTELSSYARGVPEGDTQRPGCRIRHRTDPVLALRSDERPRCPAAAGGMRRGGRCHSRDRQGGERMAAAVTENASTPADGAPAQPPPHPSTKRRAA